MRFKLFEFRGRARQTALYKCGEDRKVDQQVFTDVIDNQHAIVEPDEPKREKRITGARGLKRLSSEEFHGGHR